MLVVHSSCAKQDAAGTRRVATTGVSTPARPSPRQVAIDTARAGQKRYSVEDEVPGQTPSKPVLLQEKIAPVATDTFNVQEKAIEEPVKALYGIVYRIQVFASSDRAAAEKVKQRVSAETGLRAYLDYEDGLYKVRAGDFSERKGAAEARAKLVAKYPGSWIVMATVRR